MKFKHDSPEVTIVAESAVRLRNSPAFGASFVDRQLQQATSDPVLFSSVCPLPVRRLALERTCFSPEAVAGQSALGSTARVARAC